MKRLDWPGLPESEGEEESRPERRPIDPRKFASLSLQVEDLRYKGKRLGELVLRGESIATGLHFDQIVVTGTESTLDAEGSWQMQEESQRTQLSGKVASNPFWQDLNRTRVCR